MPTVSSNPQTTKVRMFNTSHVDELHRTDLGQCNLRPSIPANDNLQPWLTTPVSGDSAARKELGGRLQSYPDEIVKLPSGLGDMIFAFALVAALVLIAWFYALSFPSTANRSAPGQVRSGIQFQGGA